jgi:hypothetical protein
VTGEGRARESNLARQRGERPGTLRLCVNPFDGSRNGEVARKILRVSAGTCSAVVEPGARDEGKQRGRQGGHDLRSLGVAFFELGAEEVDDRVQAVMPTPVGAKVYDLGQ